jgi:hypothetical protein
VKTFATHKNLYTGPLCIINLQYRGHNHKIRSFGQVLTKTSEFWQNRRLTPMDLNQKFDFFKTRQNTYMRPLYVTNPQYGGHDREILSFGLFLPPN